jgi:hypothetical protein
MIAVFQAEEECLRRSAPEERDLLAAFLRDKNFLSFNPGVYRSLRLGTTQLYKTVVDNHKRHDQFKRGYRTYDFRVKHCPQGGSGQAGVSAGRYDEQRLRVGRVWLGRHPVVDRRLAHAAAISGGRHPGARLTGRQGKVPAAANGEAAPDYPSNTRLWAGSRCTR